MSRDARILVVDDSTFVRKALRRVLEARPGLSVAGEAGDGLEAVKMCATLAPDITRSDVFVCGPPRWITAVKRAARHAGVARHDIHTEDFAW